MKFLNIVILISFWLALPLAALAMSNTEQIKGEVLHAETHRPIAGAHVHLHNTDRGTVTDRNGKFELTADSGYHILMVSHVGYATRMVQTNTMCECHNLVEIFLEPEELRSRELLVTAGRMQMQHGGVYSSSNTKSVDDHMSAISGLDMVTRANMAKDPVIRGLRDGRVNVLIDGMRLTPACVDGMDPATAYVETDNLKAIEISRGFENGTKNQSAPGGSVNFLMVRPSLNSGLSASAETGYQSASMQQLYQGSAGYGGREWAFRLSGSYRDAGNLQPGTGSRIGGSGFSKGNVMASVLFEPSDSHRLNLRYIGDFAGKIGYPMLIMDTRRADAHIAGLEHAWSQPFRGVQSVTTNIYINRVQHWMDDYDRDVSQRNVMRNMFMPMYGETLTSGITSELTASRNNHLFSASIEVFRIDAFADMLMEHADPAVRDMYLVNLGDVVQQNAILSGSHTWFAASGWTLSTTLQAEAGMNRLNHPDARATYRAEYTENMNLEPPAFGGMAAVSAERRFTENLLAGVSLSSGTRLPGHMERYGYYIYQPLDGFFYIGNAELKPERSSQAEIFTRVGNDGSRLGGSLSVWVNRMDRYIAGMRIDEMFKRMQNMGTAVLTGFEADLTGRISQNWIASGSLSYVQGTHNKLDEPLPMIPPLKGHLSLQRRADVLQLEGRLRWAAPQNRIAEINSMETVTGGYALVDFYANMQVSSAVSVRLGMENILNTFYTEHLSVNSMPAPGRNVMVSVRMGLN
jgi:iron complex outermembrane recepter protein